MSAPRVDKHVLIFGCGFTGTVLAQRLAFRGIPVVGTTRSEARASVIRTRGAQPVLFDTAAPNWDVLAAWRGRVRALVHMVPPTMADAGAGSDAYDDVTAELLERVEGWGLEALVYVSSTSVYGDHGGDVVTEATPCAPDSPRGRARREIEERVLGNGAVPATVVRPSGIYGPGRSQLHRMAAGRYRLIGEGEAITNRIHVADLAAIVDGALTRGEAGAVYLASDATPVTQREVAEHVTATYGLPAPPRMSLAEARVRLTKDVLAMMTSSKRLDASATLAALGVRLRYPSYREGLADVWLRERAAIEALAAGAPAL
ncbi:MAG: SDR family oxidoreductase [Myxococcales bacterium]|nr:SDR family oxidoreductase [Myxococcales bacterium]